MTLFNVNIDILNSIRDVLNFVIEMWRRPRNVIIQMLFIDGTCSRV